MENRQDPTAGNPNFTASTGEGGGRRRGLEIEDSEEGSRGCSRRFGGGSGSSGKDKIDTLGRLLTRILRHMASELKLDMRSDGYVKVQDLMKLNLKTFANIPLRSHDNADVREAHEVLKKKKLEKEEEGRAANQAQLENQTKSEIPLDLKKSGSKVLSISQDFKGVNQGVANTPPQNSIDASVGYFLRNALTKFFPSLRHQYSPSLLLVITIGIILLLMQISIAVLLSRPQQIQVITRGDHHTSSMIGMTSNKAETLTSLKKQIKYLREEMHFVETMLEKMQHEHVQLKGKLKELEL